jgi:hypothetical protein
MRRLFRLPQKKGVTKNQVPKSEVQILTLGVASLQQDRQLLKSKEVIN